MPFPTSPTNGQTVTVNGITYQYSTSTSAWKRLGVFSIASTSSQIQTTAQTTSATYYVTFVDANNASAAGEIVYTTSSFSINPATGMAQATQFNATSDVELKTDVKKIQNALDILKQIDGVSYTWKQTNQPSYGVIAQNIEKVLPDVVTDSLGLKSVNYNAIIAFLIEANKELQARIERLENK